MEVSREKEAFHFLKKAYRHQTAGELRAAIVNYKKSLEVFETAEGHTLLAWTYGFMERYDHAIAECKKAIELDPNFGNSYNDIAAYLIEKGNADEALNYLAIAIHSKRCENISYSYYNIERAWEKKGERLKAMSSYRRAIRENPEYTMAKIALWKLGGFFN